MRGAVSVCAGDRVALRVVDIDGLENANTLNSKTQTLPRFDGGGSGKIHGKGMNVVRQSAA